MTCRFCNMEAGTPVTLKGASICQHCGSQQNTKRKGTYLGAHVVKHTTPSACPKCGEVWRKSLVKCKCGVPVANWPVMKKARK